MSSAVFLTTRTEQEIRQHIEQILAKWESMGFLGQFVGVERSLFVDDLVGCVLSAHLIVVEGNAQEVLNDEQT